MSVSGVSSPADITYALAQNSAADANANASGDVKTAVAVSVVKKVLDEEKILSQGILDMLA